MTAPCQVNILISHVFRQMKKYLANGCMKIRNSVKQLRIFLFPIISPSINYEVFHINYTLTKHLMEYPHFRKVNFHRIEQRVEAEDETVGMEAKICRESSLSTSEDTIPEEGSTNNIKIQQYNRAGRYELPGDDFIDETDESENIITIKMPRSLRVREFSVDDSLQQITKVKKNKSLKGLSSKEKSIGSGNIVKKEMPELSQIMQETSYESRTPSFQPSQINSSQGGRFIINCFYNVVKLSKTREYCFCYLDESYLKIVTVPPNPGQQNSRSGGFTNQQILQYIEATYRYPEVKIRYFVPVRKYKVEMKPTSPCTQELTIITKSGKETIQVQFQMPKQRIVFECVYNSIMQANRRRSCKGVEEAGNQLEQKQEVEAYEDHLLSSEISIDSVKFSAERMRFRDVCLHLDTFDIILFKGRNMMSKVQRFLTNSSYDHVGLIMKSVNGSLYLFESTGNVGVAIYSFASIELALQAKSYERVAIRRLTEIRDSGQQERNRRLLCLQQFATQANGKKYKFDPLYLIMDAGKRNYEQKQEDETYFCSELVAEALKFCGIMKESKPSCQYLPKHFAESEGLNRDLNQRFYYSDPIILEA